MTRWSQIAEQYPYPAYETHKTDKTPRNARRQASNVGFVGSVGRRVSENDQPHLRAVGYGRAAIRIGVTTAFDEYEAANNPHRPEAWQ